MTAAHIISLLTDFGLSDSYVGVMKAVILGIIPDVRLVDLTHDIPPQAVRQAAFTLAGAYPYFPVGTIHLAVVDPGVGSARRAIAVQTGRAVLVGPDNGLFSYVLALDPALEVVELVEPAYRLPAVSATFHGRDIFAPAAAHLARGVPLSALGPPVQDLVQLPWPRLEVQPDGRIQAEIILIDRFGNAVTSLGWAEWAGSLESLRLRPPGPGVPGPITIPASSTVQVVGMAIPGIRRTYAEVAAGQVLALVGSSGFVEIAVRDGHAARRLGLRVGDPVVVEGARGA